MNKQQSTKKRLDVFDGLKGILILTILFYYFFQHILPGGFLAVNFFLVIAGFFAVRHFYVADRRGQAVNLVHFYRTRISRLFFPMLAMIVFTATYILLFDRSFFYNLRNMALSSLVFFNNYYQIMSQQSYFVQAANPSPFIHLWYVALYGQFVIMTPLLMMLCYKWHKKTTVAANILFVLSLLSAGLLMYWYKDNHDPSRIYYDLLTRSFAFTLGGAIGLLFPTQLKPKPMSSNVKITFNIVGTVCFMLSVVMMKFLHGTLPFTYRFGMLLYTLCSIGWMIASLHPQTLWNKILSLPIFTFFGKRSFSYYLCFYPIHLLVPAKLVGFNLPLWAVNGIQFILIVVCSEVSYRLFEQKQWSLPVGQDFDIKKSIAQIRYLRSHKGVLYGIKIVSILYVLTFAIGVGAVAFSPESKNNVAVDLQAVIEKNVEQAEETKSEPVEDVKVINNIEGLEQNVMLYANALDVTFIGDSILAASWQQLNEVFPKAVADPQIGRQLYQSVPVVESLKKSNLLKSTVITILGTNGTFTEGQIDEYIQAIGTDREQFLVTVATDRSWSEDANQQMLAAAQRYPNVKIIDWDSYANDHVEWFYEDGVHMNLEGSKAFAKYIAEQIFIQR